MIITYYYYYYYFSSNTSSNSSSKSTSSSSKSRTTGMSNILKSPRLPSSWQLCDWAVPVRMNPVDILQSNKAQLRAIKRAVLQHSPLYESRKTCALRVGAKILLWQKRHRPEFMVRHLRSCYFVMIPMMHRLDYACIGADFEQIELHLLHLNTVAWK